MQGTIYGGETLQEPIRETSSSARVEKEEAS